MVVCQFCGAKLMDGAKFCYKCEKTQEYPDQKTQVSGGINDSVVMHSAGAGSIYAPSITMGVHDKCPSCGTPITDRNRSIRCYDCGKSFCAACELDFRTERNPGEKPLCYPCLTQKQEQHEQEERKMNNEQKLFVQEKKTTLKSTRDTPSPDESSWKSIEVQILQVHGFVLIDDEPCWIMNLSTTREGKQGGQKTRIDGLGIFDGEKHIMMVPTSSTVQVPIVDTRWGYIHTITDREIQFRDEITYELYSIPMRPWFKSKLSTGDEIEYLDTMGKKMIVEVCKR
jgi:translation initiation factor 5A